MCVPGSTSETLNDWGSQRGTVGGAPKAACSASIRCEAIDSVATLASTTSRAPNSRALWRSDNDNRGRPAAAGSRFAASHLIPSGGTVRC